MLAMQFLRHKRLTLLIFSLAILLYAVPRLPLTWDGSAASWFAFSWLGFALLVVAAHFRSALGVDREEEKAMERVKRLKDWQREQRLRGSNDRYPRAYEGDGSKRRETEREKDREQRRRKMTL